ncbi:MAG: hypothetical protein IT208_16550 [Chthonomonadales bacterium]|nr:hypothetical protein [Chthonomonadales bacterium]
MSTRYPLVAALVLALAGPSALAQQTYRNVSNAPFSTVASGPMQALIVDVPAGADHAAVRRAVAARVNRARRARASAVARAVEYMRRTFRYRGELTPAVPDLVLVRRDGRLAPPPAATRGRANTLDFTFPAAGTEGSWPAAWQADLQAALTVILPELRNVYGEPAWTGTVTLVNGDNLPVGQGITDPNALSGGVFNASTREITFAQYRSAQTTILSLTQMLALAFHGARSISYDAWERGMARAATLVTVRSVLPILRNTPSQVFGGSLGDLSVADPLWVALDRYALLNQQPLGNDRFYPVSKTNTEANTAAFPVMLVPRLQMAGSAWLKVAAEDPSFFRTFNGLYYAALATNPALANNVPALRDLAARALANDGTPTVEGMDFQSWYVRQYVLDTSVSPGAKLYAQVSALRPEATADDDFAVAVILSYFRTAFDTSGNSDELGLSGTCYPIYWDYNFTSRLFLGAQYERVDIRDGMGAVAPTFFATIGGEPSLEGRMRVTMDFPVNNENVRLQVAPRSTGKGVGNNLWGVVVGADTGTIRMEADGIQSAEIDVRQGAFGSEIDSAIFSQPRRATITFTDSQGNATSRRVNTGYGEYVVEFHVDDPVQGRTHIFAAGPAMISFPIQPLRPKAAEALLDPTTGQPLFNEGNLLLAQWRQTLTGDDKYLRYPTLDPLQPGKGYWSNFGSAVSATVKGRVLTDQSEVSLALLHGWNQIGNPYETAVPIANLQFQYQADNVPVNLAAAIERGWIVAQAVPTVGQVAVWRWDQTLGYVPASTLEPWQGYWIRVLVSEGVTITYPSPATQAARSRAASTRSASAAAPAGWAVPLTVRGPDGVGATAYIGQADGASAGYDAHFDAARPPDFTRAVPSVAMAHPEWGGVAGDYFADIRALNAPATWDVTVSTPAPGKTYTLAWAGVARVPRSLRLLLRDVATGRRQYLNGSSSYAFVSGASATRRFQVTAELRGAAGLRILNLAARASRSPGGAVEIGFDLSAGATVDAQIRGADGRTVRRLGVGRAVSRGANRMLWDLRDDRAIAVPAGVYMVQVTARTPEGEVARVVQPVTVVR